MDYEKKYKEALEKAKDALSDGAISSNTIAYLQDIFPELKESEDERIREAIIDYFRWNTDSQLLNEFTNREVFAWLKKQDEHANFLSKIQVGDKVTRNEGGVLVNISQLERVAKPRRAKPTDKVEPKFKVGDVMRTLQEAADGKVDGMPVIISIDKEYYHCTNELIAIKDQDDYEFPPINVKQKHNDKAKFKVGDWIIHHGTENIYQVVAVIDNQYQLKHGDNYTVQKCVDVDKNARLWTIRDAKDGDILARNNDILSICIFGHFDGINDKFSSFLCHCGLEGEGLGQELSINGYHDNSKNYVPATKEQCDLLFQKMKDAGYEWDAEKKELKKIESAEWSEEDEMIALSIEQIMNCASFLNITPKQMSKIRTWLKSLKQRIGG